MTSTHSVLTSVFHELLGDGLAKEAAENAGLIQRTLDTGFGLISRQRRESVRDDARRFSTIHYRRISQREALDVLQTLPGVPGGVGERLAEAMATRSPLWHVVVMGVDGHSFDLVVSCYFLQNISELQEIVRSCLIEILVDDDPNAILHATRNPQFQLWCRQWYEQSEDVADDRSVRYVCRLKGCNVLIHCIRNDFGACVALLLESFSNLTAPQRWLVLAEPMRYFGRFKCNAFHEAAYSCSLSSLDALISYGDRFEPSWRSSEDSDGKTAMDIARDRLAKGVKNAAECVSRLERAYSVGMSGQPAGASVPESFLVAAWYDSEGKELQHVIVPIPAETTWRMLAQACQSALGQASHDAPDVKVLIKKVTILDATLDDILSLFELCKHARSLGLRKCRFRHLDAPVNVCSAMCQMLELTQPATWTRMYMFGAAHGLDLAGDCATREAGLLQAAERSAALAAQLLRLSEIIAKRVSLPLWRVEDLPAMVLTPSFRHVSSILCASLDVKKCVHVLTKGGQSYRPLWCRVETVHQVMLDRFRLLSDLELKSFPDAVDLGAAAFLEGCAKLWAIALRGYGGEMCGLAADDRLSENHRQELLFEVDSALSAALWMKSVIPGLPEALARVLPSDVLELLPRTSIGLGKSLGASVPVDTLEPWQRRGGKWRRPKRIESAHAAKGGSRGGDVVSNARRDAGSARGAGRWPQPRQTASPWSS